MTVESDDDRIALLADFGIDVTIGDDTVVAIFDNGFEDALGTWVTVPVLTARTTDFTSHARGTALTVGGVAYTIAEKHPDGTEISTIILQKT